jgi:hypothetical protein
MKRKRINQPIKQEKVDLPGYPLYPDSEDIYKKSEKLGTENPNAILTPLSENDRLEHIMEGEKDPKHDALGYPLDIPGSDLDDRQEAIGSEDEENNYYSIGGDNHDNLEENKGN